MTSTQTSHATQATEATRGTALITGASAGIGAIYADRLAKRGYDLILVARDADRLNALAARLSAETGRTIDTIPADLNDKAALARIERLLRDDARITMLVNNAGVGSVASVLKDDVDAMEAMIGLNITALTRLTYAVAPAFASRGAGTIVNIGSVVGIAVELLNGVYSASKSYVLSFGHALQRDLADKGVRIQTVMPAATATAFWDVAGYAPQKEAATTMSAADLVDAALAGLDQGELVTIPTLQNGDDWTQWEAARRALAPKFANAKAAPRYALASSQA
ncbi:SDR family NAD(P)-dependent oxidoreductase [Paraburkholderia acidisoli]|uniref:NADP-dependent 3-hydroxy acid dehydrogenase YdfG n=1 Tax=Paraburkholderia acidisoli TaxID=2571748 RepID=A0A7Z2JIP6_9BURK|nr:SDR family oxidoreductase [Paraburkholderia acidisoli]QGZ65393.1 SDR family NAD(P)-dependent oxidoreductase [Paraburkholderia acidisoli]